MTSSRATLQASDREEELRFVSLSRKSRSGRLIKPALDRHDPANWSRPAHAPESKAEEMQEQPPIPVAASPAESKRQAAALPAAGAVLAAVPAAALAASAAANAGAGAVLLPAVRPPAAPAAAAPGAMPAPAPVPVAAAAPAALDVWRRMGFAEAQRIASHPPLQREIQIWSRDSVAGAFSVRACRPFVAEMSKPKEKRDNKLLGQAALAMITAHQEMLPLLDTTRDQGKDGKLGFHKALYARLDQYTRQALEEKMLAPQLPPRPADAAAAARAKRLLSLVRAGHYHKALAFWLRSGTIADASQAEVQLELKRLMPDNVEDRLPSLPDNAPRTVVTEKLYEKRIYKACGSCAGPSGQTAEFFHAVWPNEFCRKALCLFFDAIRNGDLPEYCMPALRAARLIPVMKGKPVEDWDLIFSVANVSGSLLAARVCVELVDAQSGLTLGYTETTEQLAAHTFEVKLKLEHSVIEANAALCVKLVAKPHLVVEYKCKAQQLIARPGEVFQLPLPAVPQLPEAFALSLNASRRPPAIRPILAGEAATKIAMGAGYDKHSADIAAAFPTIQLGCGVPGGVEIAFHDVVLGLDSDMAVADLDFENAFGLRSSKRCFEAMSRMPGLAPFLRPFHALYRQPAPIFVQDGAGRLVFRHVNAQGPRQGCILGSLAFCASVQEDYQQALAQAPSARAVAIIDNFTLVGPIAALRPAAEHMLKHAPDGGGKLRRDKCKLHVNPGKPAEQSEWARDLGFTVNTHSDKYLGGFIGGTQAEQSACAMKLVRGIVSDMRTLDHPDVPHQVALGLLSECFPDRFAYIARLNSPEVLREAAREMDREMLSLYCRFAGIRDDEINATQRKQIFTPRRLGGRGLRSCEALLERSYLGALGLAARHLEPLAAAVPASLQREKALADALKAVKGTISAAQGEELLPVEAGSFISHFAVDSAPRRKQARELQRRLTSAQQLLQADTLEADAKALGTRAQALLHVNQARGASLAFTTMPTRCELALPDAALEVNERLHLQIPPERAMPVHCHCNQPNGQYALDPWHGLSCQLEKGGAITDRHDDLKYGVARWVTALGGRVKIEPRADGFSNPAVDRPQRRPRRGRRKGRAPDRPEREAEAKEVKDGGAGGRKRYDLWVYGLGPQPCAVDFCITHPLAPSHVERCAEDAESVLERAEADKCREYSGLAEQAGAKFFAFAVETTGRLGKGACDFIQHIIRQGVQFKNVWAPKEVVEGIYRTVAIAVARGNAEIVRSNLVKSRLAWRD